MGRQIDFFSPDMDMGGAPCPCPRVQLLSSVPQFSVLSQSAASSAAPNRRRSLPARRGGKGVVPGGREGSAAAFNFHRAAHPSRNLRGNHHHRPSRVCVYMFNPPLVGYEYHTPMIMKFEFTSLKKE